MAGVKTLTLDHPSIDRRFSGWVSVVHQGQVNLWSRSARKGKAHGAERDGGAVLRFSIQIRQAYIVNASRIEIKLTQDDPLVAERGLAERAVGHSVGVMDGVARLGGILINRAPFTCAPCDGIMTGDIGFNLVVACLGDERVPLPVVGRMGGVIGIEGEIGGVTAVIGEGIPICLRAGGICRVKLRIFNDHDGRFCGRRYGKWHQADESKYEHRKAAKHSGG